MPFSSYGMEWEMQTGEDIEGSVPWHRLFSLPLSPSPPGLHAQLIPTLPQDLIRASHTLVGVGTLRTHRKLQAFLYCPFDKTLSATVCLALL